MAFIVKGIIITSCANKELIIHNPGFIVIDANGIIQEITDYDPCPSNSAHTFVDYSNHLIIPGLIDLHNHLPQFAYAGLGDGQLLDWLNTYTFPREQQLANPTIAQTAAKQFFSSLAAAGTTTTVTYVTIHEEATDIAFAIAEQVGLRTIMGKIMMDQNSPAPLQEKMEQSLAATERLIKKWHGKNNKLFYAITPRFAITCSAELLKRAATLAKTYGTYIQTHLSENKDEIATVKKLFPQCKQYLDVYHQAELLGPKTIMAHGIHLSNEEQELLCATQTTIAHCPTSNRFLMSGIMPTRHYLNANMHLGLGSDVAGGYSLSMLHELRECLESSKTLSVFNATHPTPLTLEEGFYLATLGGATAIGLDAFIGSLEVGKAADFVVLDPQVADPYIWTNDYNESRSLLIKCIYTTRGNPVIATYVQGSKIG